MKLFVPDMYQQSVYKINYKKLKRMGIKCIAFDLDNTLAPYSEHEPNKKMKEFFLLLQEDFKVIILSNNIKSRVRPFKEGLNIDSSHSSKKPLKGKYKKILSMYKLKPGEVACVGDQIMTDVLGANRMDMISVLVNSLSENEPVNTKINRIMENMIIKNLQKKGILHKGEYYD